MKLLLCVQRYGDDVAGGAESACRGFAEGLARRGHTIEVATSAARDYVTWADHYPTGASTANGVTVHRFGVRKPRSEAQFGPLSARVLGAPTSLAVQRDWLRVQGPDLPDMQEFLRADADRYDAVILHTYLYPTSALAVTVAACRAPVVLHPAAHQEPMLAFDVYEELFGRVDGLAFYTPEEQALVVDRFRPSAVREVVGVGVEANAKGDGARFRRHFGIEDGPLLLFVGRVDRNKGSDELISYFREFRRRDRRVTLAVVGQPIDPIEPQPGVVVTGFVDEQTKYDAFAAATVFVNPSYFESFSIVLCESFLHRRPALVQERCDVLAGQVRRSRGGLTYSSFAEFDAALTRLLDDAALRDRLGESGRRYTIENYAWGHVLTRYEAFLSRVIESRRH
ncbi:MAG: glycosyltransferase family 4 protein [Acidimicrobiales bacterium]